MPRRNPGSPPSHFIEALQQQIAARLDVDPDRIRFCPLEGGTLGRLNTAGDHWQIHYRGCWRELPWALPVLP